MTSVLPLTRSRKDVQPLRDRYSLSEGTVFLSGVQALTRVLLDQHRADAAAGLRTATMVSGYQGSPLAGFDREIGRLGELAEAHRIELRPGLNEELGATVVWGSQLTNTLPGATHDGVLGVWYGKAPGVDRAADAIRHGNYVGTDPRGGVLALCGDDPGCKSSTLPSASESILAALHVPVLAPGNVQELLDYGRHAVACSRASGLWAAMKVVTAVADATSTVDVGLRRVAPRMPRIEYAGAPYVHRPTSHLLAPQSLEMEATLTGVRTELAREYARMNDLNVVTRDDSGARIGLVASGAAYYDLMQALSDLGIDERVPIRILKIGMPYPLDPDAVRRFAHGLDELLVVEEKGPFLEGLVVNALYGAPNAPLITGQRDHDGAPLMPIAGVLDVDTIARGVARRLDARFDLPGLRSRLDQLNAVAARPALPMAAQRTPAFCSGCPHNTSTPAPDDAVVGAGIGCHTMIMLNPAGKGNVNGLTQMGGEGTQWIGVAPFTSTEHFFQNLGDGTYHHSGSLAIRAAIAARLNVTYKLLYNDTVAMTGGQHVEGQMSVSAVARSLDAEGVKRIVITTEDRSRYRDLPASVQVRDRSDVLAVQRELAQVPGVTVMIHDQGCAAELRRARKRGKAPEPAQRVLINERVCEGCGDCGQKSGCLSVEPVETEFGRKTRIHQASCNKDFSCLEGDCPSFLTVVGPAKPQSQPTPVRLPTSELPPAVPCVDHDDTRLRLVGIGGTGVVTVSQVLGVAAMLDGLHASGVDQTGLSQKAGPVVSDVRFSTQPIAGSASPSAATADVLVGLDVLGTATPRNLAVADPDRTVAVISTSAVPTNAMVTDVGAPVIDVEAAVSAIRDRTRADHSFFLDAQAVSQELFGDHLPANLIVLGAAWQLGAVPVSAQAIDDALRFNGAGVEKNRAAFAWGRAAVAAPDELAAVMEGADDGSRRTADGATATSIAPLGEISDELRRLLFVRVPELRAWGGSRAVDRYLDAIAETVRRERRDTPGSFAVSEALAHGLHKLMAYKDEYEIARLHLAGLDEVPEGAKVYFHLHPPLLRALGLKRKLRLGRWFVPFFRLLARSRALRGTPLDLFGYARVRRVERALPGEYLGFVRAAIEHLAPETVADVVAVAELPDMVRGYEEIKLDGVERFRAQAPQLLEQLAPAGDATTPVA